jgi:hypothetical protein
MVATMERHRLSVQSGLCMVFWELFNYNTFVLLLLPFVSFSGQHVSEPKSSVASYHTSTLLPLIQNSMMDS